MTHSQLREQLPSRMPNELLSMVFDYIDLAELVCLMRVSRGWLDVVLDHPTYWQKHVLERYDPIGIDGFLLRLNRTSNRPITINIANKEPSAALCSLVFPAIATHLDHTSALHLSILSQYHTDVFTTLQRAAPLLRHFTLIFSTGHFVPVMPADIFCGVSPLLTSCALLHVFFTDPPPSFSNAITTLEYGVFSSRHPLEQHRLAAAFPRVRNLMLYGRFSWQHMAPLWPTPWLRLECLSLALTKKTLEAAAPHIVLDGIHMTMSHWRQSDAMYWLMEGAFAPLTLRICDFPLISAEICLSFDSGQTGRVRAFTIQDIGRFTLGVQSPYCLLASAGIAPRITLLSITAALWDPLALLLPLLPSLVELEIVVYQNGELAGIVGAASFCPNIKSLTLRSSLRFPCMAVRHLSEFAQGALHGVSFPLALNLRNVLLEGDHNILAEFFASIIHATVDTPIYPYPPW